MNLNENMLTPRSAPLITVVSASGGVGKSTLALLMAHLAAQSGISTALVEGDLQFGDMGFWLGMDVNLPNLSQGLECVPITISNNLDFYKAPVLPEIAERISDEVCRLLPSIRNDHDLVFADTGQFWSGLTGELITSSDLILLVMDQRESSIYGAIKALELCQRLGVPSARIMCVSNKTQTRSKANGKRICTALGIDELITVTDGKASVESLVSMGRVEELAEGESAPICDMKSSLSKLLPRVGIEYAVSPRAKSRRLFS